MKLNRTLSYAWMSYGLGCITEKELAMQAGNLVVRMIARLLPKLDAEIQQVKYGWIVKLCRKKFRK